VNHVRWLGHGTVLIHVDGSRLLVDPVLRRRVGLLHRTGPVPDEPLGRLDGILITHAHRDHLDLPSLRRLAPGVDLVVPRGAEGHVAGLDAAAIHTIDVGERLPIGGVAVVATPADHDGRRGPRSPQSPALGFVVEGSSRVYVAGDTAGFPEMAALSAGLDLALLPVAGWGPTLGPGHMDARQAAEALGWLRPRAAIPIHWGTLRPVTFPRSARYLHDPPHEFARAAAASAPETRVVILPPGGSFGITPPD
jgi:L-ascorbate metabolism protein UlaG (beta-lactamase superfamily)